MAKVASLEKIYSLRRKSRVGQLVLVLLSCELLFLSSFCGLNLPIATGGNIANYGFNACQQLVFALPPSASTKILNRFPELTNPSRPVRESRYLPEAPISVFVGYVLGPLLGPLACFIVLLFGLVGPFAGLHLWSQGQAGPLWTEPGFGYVLGMICAAWASGRLTVKGRSSFRQCLAVFGGLCAIHVTGLLYMIASCLINTLADGTHLYWRQWLFEEMRNLSWYPLPYDIIFTTLLIGAGFPFRLLSEILTAPDIALRAKSQPKLEEI